MLKLISSDLIGLATGDAQTLRPFSPLDAATRSNLFIATSTAIGGGFLYLGMRKGGWWHILTAVGIVNLAGNGVRVARKLVTR